MTTWQPAIILRHFLRRSAGNKSWMFPGAVQRLSVTHSSTIIFLGSVPTILRFNQSWNCTDSYQNWKRKFEKKKKNSLIQDTSLVTRVAYFICFDFSRDAFEYNEFLRNQTWVKMRINWILSGQAHHKNNTRKRWIVNDLLTPRKQSDTVVPNMQFA